MWRSVFYGILFLLPTSAGASAVVAVSCESRPGGSTCRIKIDGAIEAGERIFIAQPQDADRLFYGNREIGSTGHFLGHEFSAAFFPRVYSLRPITGVVSPELILESTYNFSAAAGEPKKIKIIPNSYPLHRVFGKTILRLTAFLLFFALAAFLILRLRRTTIDGWTYPLEEMRWFFGALFLYMLAGTMLSHLPSPAWWSANFHGTVERTALAVTLWSLAALVLGVRFNDRSCVERGTYRRPPSFFALLADFSLLFALSTSLSATPWVQEIGSAAQGLPLALAFGYSVRSLEWRRIWKRSGFSPLFFQFTLMAAAISALPLAFLSLAGILENAGNFRLFGFLVVLAGAWRMHRFLGAKQRSVELVKECRASLLRHTSGKERLRALCEFVEDEWAAARVSIISVQGSLGLVIASAGPDAIPDTHHPGARKLGPFLRRVCRAGHILYAPVAEELGKDLQDQGMKHSSLAMPFSQQGKIRAVLCMMADEGERIPAVDATVLELMAEDLSLEILSAVSQYVAEEKCASLLSIAQASDGIAVEHMNDWGHLLYADKEEERFLVGGKVEQMLGQGGVSVLQKVQQEFQKELFAIWHSLALAFEFVPKEVKDDFWVLSPREFRHPYLRQLGPARAGVALAHYLDKHAKALATKEAYLVLALPALRVVAGQVKLQLVSYGGRQSSSLEIDSRDREALYRLREKVSSAGPGLWGDLESEGSSHFQLRAVKINTERGRGFWSILSVSADKKETRKLETKALDTARDSLKKAS